MVPGCACGLLNGFLGATPFTIERGVPVVEPRRVLTSFTSVSGINIIPMGMPKVRIIVILVF